MRAVIIALVCLAFSHQIRAQVCEPDWLPGDGVPGIGQSVQALTTFDPDGDGPSPALLIVGGGFNIAGDVQANRTAAWDGQSWAPLGSGMSDIVWALTVFDDGSGAALYAGGNFTQAGGQAASSIARWDGQSWTPLGSGTDGAVFALTVFDDGAGPALYAAGFFRLAGGQPTNTIARWDGQSWSPLGSGFNGAFENVFDLTVFDDGSGPALYAGGDFTQAGGQPASRIARWDGQSWSSVGSGTNQDVYALTVFDDGSGPALYAGGQFAEAGGQPASSIARWDGQSWAPLDNGTNGVVHKLTVFDDGSGPALLVAGSFSQAGGQPASNIAKWDGQSWSPLGSGANHSMSTLIVFDDGSGSALYAGGQFTEAGGQPASSIARWDGQSWSPLGNGTNGSLEALTVFDDGSGPVVYAGGSFTHAGAETASHIAKWDGQSWAPLDIGTNGAVRAIAIFDDGSGSALYAAGSFTQAGGQPASRVARWDGQSWSALDSGTDGVVYALTVYDDGAGPALYAGGSVQQAGSQPAFGIARWDGQSWAPLNSGTNGQVNALTVFDDGSGPALYAGGWFAQAGGQPASRVARWDGQSWSPLGSGTSDVVQALTVFDDGSGPALYAGGSFTQAGGQPASRVARWDGQSWSPLGSGTNFPVRELAVFDDGSGPALYAGGLFTQAGGQPANGIAKWDGQSWSAVGSGTNDRVLALTGFDPDGPSGPAAPRLVAGGQFTTAGDHVSAYFAQFGEDTSTWAQPSGGDFDLGSNWLCDRALSSFDNFVIDGTAAGYTFANYGIALPGDPEPLRALTMRARTDVVSPFNLRGQSLEITGGTSTIARPALTIGELPDLGAQLTIRNISATPASVSAASLTIADQPTMPGVASLLGVRDANSVLDIAGDAYIGRRGDSGELLVQSGATASLGGVISVGTEAGAGGLVRVLGSGSTLLHSEQNRSMAIGQSGDGALIIGSGGSAQSLGQLDTLILGTNPSGVGSVEIAGASSSWSFDANRFIVGNRGAGSVLIRNGALLDTNSSFSVDLALQPGSTGVVELRDAGSRWVETAQSITVHEGGQLIIGDGATLAAPAINIRSGGMLEGDGAIGVGFFDAEVINLGDVAPRTESGDPATLTIQGDFRQLDALPGQPADRAGRLRLTLSETAASSISVQGIADVRGGLIIDAPQGVMLDDAADLSFLNADFGVDGRFDVVFLAGQPRNDKGELLALAVHYPTTRGFGDTLSLTTIATVAIDVEGTITQVNSTGSITDGALADFDGDGRNDLALSVVDGGPMDPGSVVILFNGGNDMSGEWLGFTGSGIVEVGVNPSAIAAGDLTSTTCEDIVVTNRADNTAMLLTNNGGGSFTRSILTATGAAPSAVILQDLDGDTRTDVAIAARDDDTVTVYLNNGGVGGAWLGVTPQTPVAVGDAPVDLAGVDNDDDKDLDDIASIHELGDDLLLLDNDGGGALTAGQTVPVGLAPRFLLTADLDNDIAESLDLITADSGGDTISVVLDEPGPDVAPSVQIPLGFTPRFIAAADLDSDGDRDLAILAESGAPANEIAVLRNDLTPEGDLVLAQDDPIVLDAPIRFLIAGDIDNDNADDLIAITETPAALASRGMTGDQVVRFAVRTACPGDANGDRIVDFSDLNAVLVGFGFAGDLEGDVTGDGLVNFEDLNAVLVAFGSNCPN